VKICKPQAAQCRRRPKLATILQISSPKVHNYFVRCGVTLPFAGIPFLMPPSVLRSPKWKTGNWTGRDDREVEP